MVPRGLWLKGPYARWPGFLQSVTEINEQPGGRALLRRPACKQIKLNQHWTANEKHADSLRETLWPACIFMLRVCLRVISHKVRNTVPALISKTDLRVVFRPRNPRWLCGVTDMFSKWDDNYSRLHNSLHLKCWDQWLKAVNKDKEDIHL